jgi:eukaryotic-like serine/threonine-protein kinase
VFFRSFLLKDLFVKYRLSKNISVSNIDLEDLANLPERYHQDYYLLYDEVKDREFLINATIKYFLDKFSTSKTELEIVSEVQADLNSSSADMEKTCSEFFKFLSKKKIIVPENYVEPELVEDPLFTEGELIGNYEVLEVLSVRQVVDIYLVKDKATEETLVVKLLDRKKASEEKVFSEELQELEKEYSMLKKVKDVPYISEPYNFHKQEEYAYITLEYIDGQPLSAFLKNTAGLTESDCLDIIKSILEAFSLLHDRRLIHGDIHSSNVLITEDKKVRIIDLGLSRTVEMEENELVKFGGVDFYMPPERINITSIKKHSKEPDLYSDVYQIGLLIYLVLYNTTPFDGFTWEELAQSIKESNVTLAKTSFLGYHVPNELISLVKRCLEKEPAKRFENATHILEHFIKQPFLDKVLSVN